MSEHRSPQSNGGAADAPDWRLWVPVVVAVVRRPDLWGTAVRQSLTLAPDRWWTRRPWLPLPAAEFLRFRMLTAYGDPTAGPESHDVITWLEWSRSWKSMSGSSRLASRAEAAPTNPSDVPSASH